MMEEQLKQLIQQSYRQFLQNKQLQPRYGQRLMIAQITNMLLNITENEQGQALAANIAVIEAGTGIGKTLAYLLAVIPYVKANRKKLIVSTATVALQEQILAKDLPDIRLNTELDFTFQLAKGRSRYVCLVKLDHYLHNQDGQQDAFTLLDPHQSARVNLPLYRHLLKAYGDNEWDGDRDSWPENLVDDDWRLLTSDHHQCTGHKCPYIKDCSFYRARSGLDNVDCIVANHDLVLSDLALGGGVILPAPDETIYIFDEGHHLPSKALNHFSGFTRVRQSIQWLGQLSELMNSLNKFSELKQLSAFIELRQNYPQLQQQLVQQLGFFADTINPLLEEMQQHGKSFYVFTDGTLPEPIRLIARQLTAEFTQLYQYLFNVETYLSEQLEDRQMPLLQQYHGLLSNSLQRLEHMVFLWRHYSNDQVDQLQVMMIGDNGVCEFAGEEQQKKKTAYATVANHSLPIARWMNFIQDNKEDFECHCSPIIAADVLTRALWDHCYAAVVTSATLTSLGSFARFQQNSGISADMLFSALPHAFDYHNQAIFKIPRMNSDPRQSEQHTQEIIKLLPGLLAVEKGTLVLFASYKQMHGVMDELDQVWQDKILLQGHSSKQQILRQHRENIDKDKASIIFGVASFAEGVDLAGDYCTHVIIAKLPFSVPDDPLELTLADWISQQGGNAFMDIAVHDVAIRLVQACGRLIRTREDHGIITLLDRRLVTKTYGQVILNSLPPFKLVIEQ